MAPTWQDTLQKIYRYLEREAGLQPAATIATTSNVAKLLIQLQEHYKTTPSTRVEVFVTGLVGSILSAAQWSEPEAPIMELSRKHPIVYKRYRY
jgi:hypothetical protein